jgi:hypothetical protein
MIILTFILDFINIVCKLNIGGYLVVFHGLYVTLGIISIGGFIVNNISSLREIAK